ncbi:MAG: hypothetical protein ACXW5W_08155 [Candidatus Binatia bacterium]
MSAQGVGAAGVFAVALQGDLCVSEAANGALSSKLRRIVVYANHRRAFPGNEKISYENAGF